MPLREETAWGTGPSTSTSTIATTSAAAAALPSSSSLRSPTTPPAKRNSSTIAHAFGSPTQQHGTSPPTTPSPRARRRPQHKGKQPFRALNDSPEDLTDRPKHSHELSWSNTTRDSLVDNLLFSLDTLSRPGGEEETPRAREYDWEKWSVPTLPSSFVVPRGRSHTYSSSVSSTFDRQHIPDTASTDSGSTLGIRNTSAYPSRLSHQEIKEAMPPLRSEDGYTSADVPQADEEEVTAMPTLTDFHPEQINSSVPFQSSRPSWKRRSVSLNQLYADAGLSSSGASVLDRGRPVPSVFSKYDAAHDNPAPEPNVANGPRTLLNPDASGPVYVNLAPKHSALRKAPTQSDLRSTSHSALLPSIPSNVRSQASNFVRASSIRGSLTSPPVSGTMRSDSSSALQNPRNAYATTIATTRERPGFFRRVFGVGSSRTTPTSPRRIDSAVHEHSSGNMPRMSSSAGNSRTQTESRQESRDNPSRTPYVPPAALSKKPSSFFRRRKKSTSDSIPPLPPPPQNLSVAEPTQPQRRSSISSLRKVMGQYLDGAADPRGNDSSRPTTQSSSAAEDSEDPDIFHTGYTPPLDAALEFRDSNGRTPTLKSKFNTLNEGSPKMRVRFKRRRPDLAVATTATGDVEDRSTPAGQASSQVRPTSAGKENGRPTTDGSERNNLSPTDSSRIGRLANSPVTNGLGITNLAAENDSTGSREPRQGSLQPSVSGDSSAGEERKLSPLMETTPTVGSTGLKNQIAIAPAGTSISSLISPLTPSTEYHSAASSPVREVQKTPKHIFDINGVRPSQELTGEDAEYLQRARKIFDGNEEDVNKADAAAWLGENNTLSTRTRQAFMGLFDFSGVHLLAALRILAGRLVLRGETQQFDRIITALADRWCECNPNHGFKAQDVVHTILYSLILLNTDLHLADISEKMSRSAYVKNTLPTIRRVVVDAAPGAFDQTIRPAALPSRPTLPWTDSSNSVAEYGEPPASASSERTSLDSGRGNVAKRLSVRPPFPRADSDGGYGPIDGLNMLVNHPCPGSVKSWELEIEAILKAFFLSIKNEPLPLSRPPVADQAFADRGPTVAGQHGPLRRSGSIISKAGSDAISFRKASMRAMTLGLQSKYNRSKPKLYPPSTLGSSSRTSFDDGNSVWSPAQSSNLSKYSFGKTLTSASMQSLGQHYPPSLGDFKHSIGFANALSQAIIREEAAGNRDGLGETESLSASIPHGLLEDDALALEGAPWAKEGLVKHKHHLEAQGKRAKDRHWNECFAVISTGKLTLFAFNTSTKSMGRRTLPRPSTGGTRASSIAAPTVGGGDWMENAEQLDVFILRQTIASTLPPPGYSKTRPHVWALSLPSGAVHLFQVGTPEIAAEFKSTANYWSARLSKEPLSGGVSNVEYGWSDDVVNTALLDRSGFDGPLSPAVPVAKSRSANHIHSSSITSTTRPSFQSASVRGSFDTGFGSRARLPGDRIQIAEWMPPTQSMMPSQLMEVDQLRALTAYVQHQEAELERHNELKHAIEFAYTSRHANHTRAIANWQRKSDYLLREIVKFRTYMDSLAAAQAAKESFYARRAPRPAEGASTASAVATHDALLSPPTSQHGPRQQQQRSRTGSLVSASSVASTSSIDGPTS